MIGGKWDGAFQISNPQEQEIGCVRKGRVAIYVGRRNGNYTKLRWPYGRTVYMTEVVPSPSCLHTSAAIIYLDIPISCFLGNFLNSVQHPEGHMGGLHSLDDGARLWASRRPHHVYLLRSFIYQKQFNLLISKLLTLQKAAKHSSEPSKKRKKIYKLCSKSK